ncbi:asparagine synthase (glutamine-hydrolyzing) [Alkalihalobacillus trypoxylicola]|uniref:asparagine synthase (glutamine-hydrolyzing) n=1 Tax=Alkalihalobacillus trypoxylicola TaxID=519424 RepID=A0A162DDG6_9BACI|nr:asparagine synthase (glutamine-hydrolyzing) [Alkalihalobacillus trypoxylicola]KYG29280.1 asparagine synthetase B [Alkalihalobacillus trypoxylicola]
MCGFLGEIKLTQFIDKQVFKEGLELINHRGPDSTGLLENEEIRFGFKRLSIIDLENGSQPLSDESKRYHIIFNGEIYNFIELRQELMLKGYHFQTETDTEVILALYAQQKERCVESLRGMFSFIIYDELEGKLFAARDRFGIKPFFYYQSSTSILFASELKSLTYCMSPKGTLNDTAIQHYMSFQYVPDEMSMYEEIEKLPPGHFLSKEKNKPLKVQAYHQITFQATQDSFSQHIKNVQNALADSVEKHMRSDVPVGAFLSGGIDSSVVVALASQIKPDLKTFTVGFEQEGYTEIDVAKKTAAELGVENIHKFITPEEFLRELPRIIWHLDEPVSDPAAIPLYFVAKEAKKEVKVVLSGEGADELFGGYNIYREAQAVKWFHHLPNRMNKWLYQIASILPEGLKGKNYLLRGTTPLSQRYIGNAFIFNEKEKERLLCKYEASQPTSNIVAPFYQDSTHYDHSTIMQYIDVHTWLPGDILVKADRMTMAHSIELRVPFLDSMVLEVAQQIPSKYKLSHSTTKYVLRKAIEGLVPDSVVNRKKLGFPVPIRLWLKDEWYDWALELIYTSQTDQWIDKNYVRKLLEEHALGKFDHSRKLWTVLHFMIWYSLYIDHTTSIYQRIDKPQDFAPFIVSKGSHTFI